MRDGLQPLLSFHSEICVCSGEKQAAERGDARLLWQGDGVQGLKPDPLFFVAVVARLKPCPVTKQEVQPAR
jgi:hypothetical protein